MQIQSAMTTQVDAFEANPDLLDSWHEINWKKGNGIVGMRSTGKKEME